MHTVLRRNNVINQIGIVLYVFLFSCVIINGLQVKYSKGLSRLFYEYSSTGLRNSIKDSRSHRLCNTETFGNIKKLKFVKHRTRNNNSRGICLSYLPT